MPPKPAQCLVLHQLHAAPSPVWYGLAVHLAELGLKLMPLSLHSKDGHQGTA